MTNGLNAACGRSDAPVLAYVRNSNWNQVEDERWRWQRHHLSFVLRHSHKLSRRCKCIKGRLRSRREIILPAAPFKLNAAGMQSVLRQDEPRALLIGQALFHKGK